ncbi:MAG: hypothetical protein IPM52_04415 [Bacteroidetes bacterium]|nr:hypothetical protein [Bacteroidota bacterium]
MHGKDMVSDMMRWWSSSSCSHELAQLKRMLLVQRANGLWLQSQSTNPFELPEPQKPEPQTQQINYTRTKAGQKDKQQPLRLGLPAHLPRKHRSSNHRPS